MGSSPTTNTGMNQSRIKAKQRNFRLINHCQFHNSASKYWIIYNGIDTDAFHRLLDTWIDTNSIYGLVDNGINSNSLHRHVLILESSKLKY